MPTRLQLPFFYFLLAGVSILAFFIFFPYLQVLFLAIVLAVVFYPLYRLCCRVLFGWESGSAFVSVILILMLTVLPLTGLGYFVFQEVKEIYLYYNEGEGNLKLLDYIGQGQRYLGYVLPDQYVPETTIQDIDEYFSRGYTWLGQHVGGIFSNTVVAVTNIFILVLGLFFFLRDGDRFKKIMIKLSPLQNAYDEQLLGRMAQAVNSVVLGSILVAIIQGGFTTLGLFLFQVPSPFLWGTVAAIASFIPALGTVVVIVPAVVYVFFTHGILMAAGLALWGMFMVGLVDNFLLSYLFARSIKIHPFLIFLSVFGGIGFFGILGFMIGPILLALFFALVDIQTDISQPTHQGQKDSTLTGF